VADYLTSIDVLYPFIPASDLNELLDDDGDGTADTTIFTALAAFVESQFHGYVVRRYQIPLDTTDATILAAARMYCSRLFEYAAFARRRNVTQEIGARYTQVIKELESIRDGKIGFNDPPTLEASVVGGEYTAEDDDRDYTASTMQYFGGSGNRT
jgi:phage gp36-like protein